MDNPAFMFDPEKRKEVVDMLAWPEERTKGAETVQDRAARRAAAAVGINVDRQMAAAWEARQVALAQQAQEVTEP